MYLCWFVGKFDFYFTTFSSKPQKYLFSIVKYHDVIICQIILEKNKQFLQKYKILLAKYDNISHIL